ncbi:MAG: hypothetical protein OXG15_07055 [Gammaproteobacteria bacterium]|nr:hypothetical protein [Gammaproteobacteria bacterium]
MKTQDALNRRTYDWPLEDQSIPLLSVTTICDTLHDRGLEYVRNKMIATEAVTDEGWQDLSDESAIQYLAGAANRIREDAADRGTRLHKLIEDQIVHDIKADIEWYEDIESSHVEAAQNFIHHYYLLPEEHGVELPIANLDEKYAGTVDLLCKSRAGQLWCIDWKTGKKIGRSAALQITALSHATHYYYNGRSVPLSQPIDRKVVVKLQDNGDWRAYFPKNEDRLWTYFKHLVVLAYWDKYHTDTVGELFHPSVGRPKQ